MLCASSSSNSDTTFRSSILRRLRNRPSQFSTPQARLRSVPATIVEESEDDVQDELEEKGPLPTHLADLQSSNALNNLEEQNRVLQERLVSHQSVLNRLLGSRLDVAMSTPSQSRSTRGSQYGGVTKTLRHVTKLQAPLSISTSSNQIEERVDAESAARNPLSPAAA